MKTNRILNVRVFSDPAELLEEFDYEMTEDQKKTFSGWVDFEPVGFVVLDGEMVITYDTINGDVLSDMEIGEFYRNHLKAYEEAEI